MTNARSLIAIAIMTAFTSAAFAQTAGPASRSDVKANARAADRSGNTAEGEIKDGSGPAPTGMSNKSRRNVKNEARAAVQSGSTAEGEKGGTSYSGPEKDTRTSSTKSRATVKNEARAAVKSGTTAEGEVGDRTTRK